jgi:GNAT superfamily N-acetyltransferase
VKERAEGAEAAGPPRIGPATGSDVPCLLRIRHDAFAAQAPAAYSAREVATLLGDVDPAELRALAAAGQLFVARRGDAVVGVAGWQGDRVRHVYVDPSHTRRGIATALLRRVEGAHRGAGSFTPGSSVTCRRGSRPAAGSRHPRTASSRR